MAVNAILPNVDVSVNAIWLGVDVAIDYVAILKKIEYWKKTVVQINIFECYFDQYDASKTT